MPESVVDVIRTAKRPLTEKEIIELAPDITFSVTPSRSVNRALHQARAQGIVVQQDGKWLLPEWSDSASSRQLSMLDNTLTFTVPVGTWAVAMDPTYGPKQTTMRDISQAPAAANPGVTHYQCLIPVSALPADLPNHPNLRSPNLRTKVSKEVAASLRSNDGNFHLKNKGITLLVSDAAPVSDGLQLRLDRTGEVNGDGILDGGHTYAIIRAALDVDPRSVDNQHVFVFVRNHVPQSLRADIAAGLNLTTAVTESSLANRLNEYDWVKELLPAETHDQIVWRQNDTGLLKIEDLIAQMYAVNTDIDETPVAAYASRAKTLSTFRKRPDQFKSHAAATVDTLKLYEHIRHDLAADLKEALGDRALDTRSARSRIFTSGEPEAAALAARGIALPVLSGFRAVLAGGETKGFDRSYDALCELYSDVRPELLKAAKTLWSSAAVGGDPGAFGKRPETWTQMHEVVRNALADQREPAQTFELIKDGFGGVLIGDWELELEEEEGQLEVIRVELSRLGPGRERDMQQHTLDVKDATKRGLLEAIEYARSGNLGTCSGCGGEVPDQRLETAATATRCIKCA